jgi:hypothetical protein
MAESMLHRLAGVKCERLAHFRVQLHSFAPGYSNNNTTCTFALTTHQRETTTVYPGGYLECCCDLSHLTVARFVVPKRAAESDPPIPKAIACSRVRVLSSA